MLRHNNSIYLLQQEVKKTGTFFKGTCHKTRAGANLLPGKRRKNELINYHAKTLITLFVCFVPGIHSEQKQLTIINLVHLALLINRFLLQNRIVLQAICF